MSSIQNRESLVIFGAGGHAKSVVDVVLSQGIYDIAGFIDSTKPSGSFYYDYQILGVEQDLLRLLDEINCKNIVVAIGDNYQRQQAYERINAISNQFEFPTLAHAYSERSDSASIGEGVVLFPGSIVSAEAKIEDGCIVNTRASVDHDGVLKSFSSLAPGVTLSGGVEVGHRSAIGTAASVVEWASVGSDCVIGAGSVVISDIENEVVAIGNPCTKFRSRQIGEPYLRSRKR